MSNDDNPSNAASTNEPSKSESTQSFDSNLSMELTNKLNEFRFGNKKYCDAVLEADGEKFEVHKNVLGSMSDYFDKLFNVEMKEKYEDTIKLTEISAGTLKLILDFMYTSKITLDDENVYQVLAAADYLMITHLKENCCDFLVARKEPKNTIKIWISAMKYNEDDLKKEIETFISEHLKDITKDQEFFNLTLADLKQIILLKERNSVKQSWMYPFTSWSAVSNRDQEEHAYNLIMAWVKHDKEQRKEFFPELFSMLNLKKMSKTFLSQAVHDQDILLDYHETVRKAIIRIAEGVLEAERNQKSRTKRT